MPRPKIPGAPEPKRRSRKGCWLCRCISSDIYQGRVKAARLNVEKNILLVESEFMKDDAIFIPAFFPQVDGLDQVIIIYMYLCDYSVRLNWQGRRTKRSVVDEDEEDGPVPKDNCIRWHHHGFSMEQIQVLGVPLEQRLDLDIIEPVDDGQKQDASTDLVSVVSNAICSGQPTVLTRSNLIFIDESQQLLSATANPEAHIVKRRLADSQSCSTASSSRSGSGMDSPVSSQRKRTRSLAQLEQLEPGPNPSLALYKQKQGPSSSVALLPCRDLFDAPLTPAASSPSDDVAHCRNWTELHSSGSPDSWSSSGNGESEDLFIPPGCLWDDSGPFSLQESPSYSEIHPLGSGAFYGYDQGVADEDVLRNNENRAVLQPLAAHRSGHGILDFAQGAKARRKRGTNGAINGSYYDNMVPVIIPWAFEPLPDM
ncbi:uncharacterized protein UV8b_01942 [Ustilaginoidea virens]|uniref:Uncharacterized protein n=1 Tax=Ustilaginoidea virens TaxID=1159556 RepID=A0A8E5MF10_USTVR|nr:uncharacterized protein UV8b_01942 [Ustilaginoidea virens]QUC17701.1 hypothetical protein UV8b_01942 [Ustilaginoidea virens]